MLRSRGLASRVGVAARGGKLRAVVPQTPLRLATVWMKARQPKLDFVLLELPQHLDIMVARLQNGENAYSLFAKHTEGAGRLSSEFKRLAIRLQLGMDMESALAELASEVKSPLVAEFVNKVTLSLRRGTPLVTQLALLSQTARSQLRVAQLKAAGRNELMMLVPLVFLILPVTVAFAILPSLQLLQLGA